MNRIILIVVLCCLINPLYCQYSQTAGVFGGDAAASGFPHVSNTSNMWLKIGEIVLNGAYKAGAATIDFYPDESPHGDSRQTVIVNLRNSSASFSMTNADIVLLTQYGNNKTIRDIKVVQTSGTGVSNNTFSIWVQMGGSWLANIPIEIRTLGNVTIHSTHQPYYTSIQESGTTWGVTSSNGFYGSEFKVSAGDDGDVILKLEADTDNVNEDDNAWIEILQDGGGSGAYIGINDTWGGGGAGTGNEADNLFRIGTRYNNTSNYNRLVINGYNGNIGIGTSTPSSKLEVNAGNNNVHAKFIGTYAGIQGIQVMRTGGADIKLVANYSSSGSGLESSSALRFAVNGNGISSPAMYVKVDGNVGIGTTTPTEKLEVNGTIRSKEVKVEASPWPDYVFADNYELPSLEAIEKFIKSNNHLPEVPSAKEVEENGIALGEMNALLLKKIEELTLYQIQMMKIINEQQEEIESLKKN
ncbi:MAG: hypothetical protein RIM99_10950 [Cyclobacteriaceae bacterium]